MTSALSCGATNLRLLSKTINTIIKLLWDCHKISQVPTVVNMRHSGSSYSYSHFVTARELSGNRFTECMENRECHTAVWAPTLGCNSERARLEAAAIVLKALTWIECRLFWRTPPIASSAYHQNGRRQVDRRTQRGPEINCCHYGNRSSTEMCCPRSGAFREVPQRR